MKVVCVVDSITDIKSKINTLVSHFGNNILYVVKANLQTIFETYGFASNAVYDNNLTNIIHVLLSKNKATDVVVYYTSLKLDNLLVTNFIKKIGDRTKIVNFIPKYNAFEKMYLSLYNSYVKSLFKINDSLASPKLQFLPKDFVETLLESHLGNKLFEPLEDSCVEFQVENEEINKTAKVKTKFGKSEVIAIIVALCLTLCAIVAYALSTPHFIVGLLFVMFYLLDISFYILLKFKALFDKRFFK